MSDLTRYKGDFLKFADKELDGFDPAIKENMVGIDSLDLMLSCDIGIFESPTNEVIIMVETETPEDFNVSKVGTVATIAQKTSNSSNVTFSGSGRGINVSGGQNVSIINGVVYVDGVEVRDGQSTSSAPAKKSRVKIFAPHNIRLDARLNGLSVMASKVVFSKASVKISGQSTVGLAAKSVKLSLSGQGDSFLVLKGGAVTASVSGQGSVKIKGDYESADLSVSGMGSIQTMGTCHEDYDASVSGMGSIANSGTIEGRKSKSVSGMGSISL